MIRDNVVRIQERIRSICQKLGRNPADITLIGVTKFTSNEKIEEALAAGITHVAENKVQEGLTKYPSLKGTGAPITRHMIGHLQTNKVKDALKAFDMIQSVDSLKLAQEIEKQGEKLNRSVDILIQLSISGEEQKFGLAPQEAPALLEAVSKMKFVRILGLMTMAPFTQDEKPIRDTFRGLKEWFDRFAKEYQNNPNVKMKYLSMGMSEDFPIALEEGANMVRIGSAIFKETPVEVAKS